VELRGDEELPARHRERRLQQRDRLLDAPPGQLLLYLRHQALELLHRPAGQQDVRDDPATTAGKMLPARERAR